MIDYFAGIHLGEGADNQTTITLYVALHSLSNSSFAPPSKHSLNESLPCASSLLSGQCSIISIYIKSLGKQSLLDPKDIYFRCQRTSQHIAHTVR